MDYTDSQTAPITDLPAISKAESERMSRIGERLYQAIYGERGEEVHVVARGSKRKKPQYTFRPRRWQQVLWFPDDRSVFSIVDRRTHAASLEGWLTYREVQRLAVPGPWGEGEYVIDALCLRPMWSWEG